MAYKAALGSRNGSVIGQLASRDSAAVEAAEAGISERSNGDLKLASSPYNKTLQFQRSKSRSSVEVDYLDEIDSDNDEIVTTRNHGNGNGQAKTNGQVSKAKFSSSSSSSVKRHQGQGLLAAFRRWTGARRGSEDISSDTIALIASTQDLAYDDDSMDEETEVYTAAAAAANNIPASSSPSSPPLSASDSPPTGDLHHWRLVKPRTSGRRPADNDNRIFLRTERDLGLVLLPPKRPSCCQKHCNCRCCRWSIWNKKPCIVFLILLTIFIYILVIWAIVEIVWG